MKCETWTSEAGHDIAKSEITVFVHFTDEIEIEINKSKMKCETLTSQAGPTDEHNNPWFMVGRPFS